ncbi:MAG: nitrogen regulation protein NR(II) [Pirellulales bacterium]
MSPPPGPALADEPPREPAVPRAEHTAKEQALVDRYTEIAQLAGALAHEIKNPLSTIRLNMELLSEEFADAESPRERRVLMKIQTVERECQRLQDLLDDFLSFAKVRAMRREPTDLNAEVARLFEFFRPQASEAGIELVTYFDPDLPSVPLDREMFRAALFNLVLNAQQAMPSGGQLVARTNRHNAGVELDLIDTGAGMDQRTLDQIFNAFYSTKPGGSGLGLPTTKKIVVAHGGSLHVESAPGKGTKFTIELPAS